MHPYWYCTQEFTSFFNNHSFLYRGNNGVSCYFIHTTPSKEDNNCFFSGSSCSGIYPVAHDSFNANCVLTKFNFVNNTDSSGYFQLYGGNHKRVKESVIAFKSTHSLRWVYGAYQSSTLSIERSFVIASGVIDNGGKVTLTSGSITTTAFQPTHTPFHSHPQHSQCKHGSIDFSNTPTLDPKALIPFLVFVPMIS